MRISVQPGTGGALSLPGRAAPGSFLVRPNGDVRPDSLRPFTFGNAIDDGVEACWAAIREGWDDERINRWAGAMKGPGICRSRSSSRISMTRCRGRWSGQRSGDGRPRSSSA